MPPAREPSPDAGTRRRSRRIAANSSLSSAAGAVESSGRITRNRPQPRANPRRTHRQRSPVCDERYLAPPREDDYSDDATTPPIYRYDDDNPENSNYGDGRGYNNAHNPPSSPQDTQPFSQFVDRVNLVLNEAEERELGVWGYLLMHHGHSPACVTLQREMPRPTPEQEAFGLTDRPRHKVTQGRFIIGRRRQETDLCIGNPALSNRHCMLFLEKGDNGSVVLEDLSTNGTFVNDCIVGRNNRKVLSNGDKIDLCHQAVFTFQYPRSFQTSAFHLQYTTGKALGAGQYGKVHVCIENSTGIRYAVKLFDADHTNPVQLNTLRQEIGMLMTLDHPKLVQIKDSFHEDTGMYIVLEYIPGGELFDFIIRKGSLREAEARRLFKQLFDGIKYLHDRNIVHRDLKPENILLQGEDIGSVKIADFGLAKIVGEDSFATTLCGTPAYVAPEVLSYSPEYNKAVDVWSLGVILYVILCGFPPFSDELRTRAFPYSMTEQIIRGEYEFPSPYWDPISDNACHLIESMLQVNPKHRFTIDQCLAHPWMAAGIDPADSTLGLVAGVQGLRVRRGMTRQRTLFADMLTQAHRVGDPGRPTGRLNARTREARPADGRRPEEFVAMGGHGDPVLYDREPVFSEELERDIASTEPERIGERGRKEMTGGTERSAANALHEHADESVDRSAVVAARGIC
ncbi:hypothetical protein BROUX41_004454 [Berkeleyomyces rouxiae]|uniref:uncharacterized protein n=1 Tax=Berkeleyomyces rouxiae TaxID=2035830 RepID=UPI003B79C89F